MPLLSCDGNYVLPGDRADHFHGARAAGCADFRGEDESVRDRVVELGGESEGPRGREGRDRPQMELQVPVVRRGAASARGAQERGGAHRAL